MTDANSSVFSMPSESEAAPRLSPCKQFIHNFWSWNPPGWLEKVVIGTTIPVLIWMTAFLLLGEKAGLPGGQAFALLAVLFLGLALGKA